MVRSPARHRMLLPLPLPRTSTSLAGPMTTRRSWAGLDRIYRRPETEAGFQAVIVQYAVLRSWRIYHTFDSRHSHAGFPDLTLVRGPRLIFAEIKTDTGRVTVVQAEWLEALAVAGAETYLWRPRDWPQIRPLLDPEVP